MEAPVVRSCDTPLAGNHAFPTTWRDSADTLPTRPAEPSALSAAEPRTRLLKDSATKPVILTLGPLTNVAETLQTDPALTDKVTAIFAMGGAVSVAGNIAAAGVGIDNATAEWNIRVDPRAANIVLSSGTPVVLVPLDATRYAPASMEFLDTLKAFRKQEDR
jgi:inosine-uridine nucleoside N-ribohydrolase